MNTEPDRGLVDEIRKINQKLSRPKRPLYIPVTEFSGYLSSSFLGTGAPNLEQINSLGIVGARIEAVTDACHHLFYIPKDFNVDTNIRIAAVWGTNSSDTSESATWKVEYSAIAVGETLIAPATALNTVIAADNVLGAYKVAESAYGTIFRGNLNHGDYLHLKISLSAVSGLNPASDIVFLLGILITDE